MVVVANDFQIPFHDEKALALFKLFLRRERPDWLVLNGDFQDFWEISSFDLTPRIGKESTEEIRIGKKILKSFRRTLPRARITWIEGNHEFRLRKYLIKNAKELYGLPGLSVPALFGLKDLKVDYVPCHSMASKFTDNFIRVGNLYVGHWDTVASDGGYAAKRLVEDKGRKPPSRSHAAIRRACANHGRRPGHSRDRKFLHVREKGELCFVSKLAAGIFGYLSGTKFRTISVVSGGDNEPNVYLEGAKI